MNLQVVDEALAATRESLEVAGFSLKLGENNGRLSLTIGANEGACEECLVPKSLFLQMVRDEMAAGGVKVDGIDVVYPVDRKAE